MAISEDASTPVVQRTTTGTTAATVTSASFTPPAGSLLVGIFVNEFKSNPVAQPTLSISDSVGGSWTQGVQCLGLNANSFGQASIWTRYCATAPGAMTVSAGRSGTAATDMVLAVRVLLGAASDQTGAGTKSNPSKGTFAATSGSQQSLTTTKAGSAAYVASGMGQNVTFTVNGQTTQLDNWSDATNATTQLIGSMTALTGTPGAFSLGWTTVSGATNDFCFAALEILPALAVVPRQPIILPSRAAMQASSW